MYRYPTDALPKEQKPKQNIIAIVKSKFLEHIIMTQNIKWKVIAVKYTFFLPKRSLNLGKIIAAIAQPAKYIDPSSPILAGDVPKSQLTQIFTC